MLRVRNDANDAWDSVGVSDNPSPLEPYTSWTTRWPSGVVAAQLQAEGAQRGPGFFFETFDPDGNAMTYDESRISNFGTSAAPDYRPFIQTRAYGPTTITQTLHYGDDTYAIWVFDYDFNVLTKLQVDATGMTFAGHLGFNAATPVDQHAAIADAANAGEVLTKFNELLAYLRLRGDIAT
jgi:hypothetical protein